MQLAVISIHSPYAGETPKPMFSPITSLFQSTRPARARRRRRTRKSWTASFQSTRPARARRASTAILPRKRHFNPLALRGRDRIAAGLSCLCAISIHSPCAGETPVKASSTATGEFQSTRPARARQAAQNAAETAQDFNPLALRGRDAHAVQLADLAVISIHSPCAGETCGNE